MNKKNLIYIFFTSELSYMGGAPLYVAGKIGWLKKQGIKVFVYSYGPDVGRKPILPIVAEFMDLGDFPFMRTTPPYKFKRYEQEQLLESMLRRLNISDYSKFNIIIESIDDPISYWAELFASKVGGRHIHTALSERYRNVNRFYEENLDFYYFKWKRNEFAYSVLGMIGKLFNGYKNITAAKYDMPEFVREPDAVQDVHDFPIDKIPKMDWNICHIGRITKEYVPGVITGVAEFARRHPDKKINFIFVGDINFRRDFIIKSFEGVNNVILTALGDMVPIPRILFSKVDVICAMAGAATHTVHEGPYLIVGSAKNPYRTPGVLGYDTKDTIYGDGTFSYVEALENVLVKKLYDKRNFDCPKQKPAEEYYKNFWTIVEKAAPTKEYYVERLSQERIREWTAIFPFGMVSRGARVILFGATEIAKDYKKQIQSQQNSQIEFGEDYIKNLVPKPYCKIVATLDEHPENFDNAVEGIERLKQKDYDVIVITTFPKYAQAAANKIVQVVPEMANRIIYNFQTLQT